MYVKNPGCHNMVIKNSRCNSHQYFFIFPLVEKQERGKSAQVYFFIIKLFKWWLVVMKFLFICLFKGIFDVFSKLNNDLYLTHHNNIVIKNALCEPLW